MDILESKMVLQDDGKGGWISTITNKFTELEDETLEELVDVINNKKITLNTNELKEKK